MKIYDEVVYALRDMGAASLRGLSHLMISFEMHGVCWHLGIDALEMRAVLECAIFDEEQFDEEDLGLRDVAEVANIMACKAGGVVFSVDDSGCVDGSITFNFNNSTELMFHLLSAMHQLLISREAFLHIAAGSRVDAHTDWRFVDEQFDQSVYAHLRDYLQCNILYVHGFRSTGNSSTAQNLREMLPHCKVVSPDLPVDAEEAVGLLRKICEEERIDVVVGTSMGGMLAQKLRGMPKILVNPAFFVSETFRKNMGTVTYFKEREDGATEFEITPEIVESYVRIEKGQFSRLTPKEIAITVGIFGNDDKTVNCADVFEEYYEIIRYFEGGHRLDKDSLKKVIIPAIAQLYRNAQRTWDKRYYPSGLTPTPAEKNNTPF